MTPEGAERSLNGDRVAPGRMLDWQEQYRRALDAFEHQGFVLLFDDRQVDDLDERIELGPDRSSEATFLELVPLVGG